MNTSKLRNEAVVITDYSYTPKSREKFSSLEKILDNYYKANKKNLLNKFNKWASRKHYFAAIPSIQNPNNPFEPNWKNSWCTGMSAISIYSMLVDLNPRYYIECGSGYSTKFALRAIQDHGLRTKIISIDPNPRAEIDSICYEVLRYRLEDIPTSFFRLINHEDIFLMDSSHRSFSNSDVTLFFLEILPRLPKEVHFALHDIFLPYDYPKEWVEIQRRFYNEQYLLASYLLGGSMSDNIVLPLYYLFKKNEIQDIFKEIFLCENLKGVTLSGSFFWMRKS